MTYFVSFAVVLQAVAKLTRCLFVDSSLVMLERGVWLLVYISIVVLPFLT